jgi:23S rRNA-/tRNA-specific pseudouridylate synthase
VKREATEVLYEDGDILVLRKPSGVSVIPERNNEQAPTILEEMSKGRGRLFVVHRIDKGTSGVLLLAKSRDAHARLNEAFRERTVSKAYLALVAGKPAWEESSCDLPLRAEGDREHRTVVDRRRGKECLTRFRLEKSWGGPMVGGHGHA